MTMGLFSWLFGHPGRVTTRDVIWLNDSARGEGVAKAVNRFILAGRSVLLVAQFPATLAAFGEHIIARKWSNHAAPDVLTPGTALALAVESAPRLLFALARNLRAAETPSPDDAAPSPLPVLVLERHPLRSHDDRVIEFAEGLGGSATVKFHVSLDDPLMKRFSGEWMQNVLRNMGMKEEEPIESPMVARRVKAAQNKIAKRGMNERDADSAEEWMRKNCVG
jgi:hypothetical protein